MPEQGEIILATVTKVMDHGAYVTLDEYDDIQGFLHISEIAPGWIRSVSRFVKDGEKKVLLVKKVKSNDIDLSLKQVSKDQKKQKLKEVKKYEKGKTLLENLQEKTKITDEEVEKLENKLGHNINLFAYPNGQKQDIPGHAVEIVKKAGFNCACSTYWRTTHCSDEVFELGRVMMSGGDSVQSLKSKVNGNFNYIYWIQEFKLIISGLLRK